MSGDNNQVSFKYSTLVDQIHRYHTVFLSGQFLAMRSRNEVVKRNRKRPRLQKNIKSMFLQAGPKFVNAVGLQPVCGYCKRKFRAPQGLSVHLHMHERAGDLPLMQQKRQKEAKRPAQQNPVQSSAINPLQPTEANVPEKSIVKVVVKERTSNPVKSSMTRRFTIAEKLQIIEKSKEGGTISENCR